MNVETKGSESGNVKTVNDVYTRTAMSTSKSTSLRDSEREGSTDAKDIQ